MSRLKAYHITQFARYLQVLLLHPRRLLVLPAATFRTQPPFSVPSGSLFSTPRLFRTQSQPIPYSAAAYSVLGHSPFRTLSQPVPYHHVTSHTNFCTPIPTRPPIHSTTAPSSPFFSFFFLLHRQYCSTNLSPAYATPRFPSIRAW